MRQTATFDWPEALMGREIFLDCSPHQLVDFAKRLRATSRICLCFRVRQRFIPSFFLDSTSPIPMMKLYSNLTRTRGLLMGIYQPGYTQEVESLRKPGGPLDRPTRSTQARRPRSVARRTGGIVVSHSTSVSGS